MSYLMDYGDRPQAPEAVEHEHEPMTLLQKCGATVILYALLWAVGALVLHALVPSDVTLVFH